MCAQAGGSARVFLCVGKDGVCQDLLEPSVHDKLVRAHRIFFVESVWISVFVWLVLLMHATEM